MATSLHVLKIGIALNVRSLHFSSRRVQVRHIPPLGICCMVTVHPQSAATLRHQLAGQPVESQYPIGIG